VTEIIEIATNQVTEVVDVSVTESVDQIGILVTESGGVTVEVSEQDDFKIDINITEQPVTVDVSIEEIVGVEVEVSANEETVVVEVSEVGRQGPPGPSGSGSGSGSGSVSQFLPHPDETDYSDPDFFYFGWQFDTGWLIRRQDRDTSLKYDSDSDANQSISTLSQAWNVRKTLNYS